MLAHRHPHGYSYAVATCDQWLLALSIGQFVIAVSAPLIALAYSAPRGTNCVCAARDYSLLALSIGQFVLLRPQIAPFTTVGVAELNTFFFGVYFCFVFSE